MKRSRSQPEVLDWEELAQAPNTKGAFSFLKVPATVINIDDHQSSISLADVKASTVDKSTTVDKTSTVAAPQIRSVQRRYKIHACQRVQDGHSHGENLLYDALWQTGRIETESTKTVTIGWDRMARAAGMSDKAAKRNLSQLIRKLAVELVAPEDSGGRKGRTYRVFSFRSILERRAAAGLTHVVKDKGVRFVTADGGPLCVSAHNIAANNDGFASKTSTVDKSSTVDNTSTGTVDKTSTDTVDKTSPLLGSILGIKDRNTTTTNVVDIAAVVAAICEYVPGDKAAARRIVESAIDRCPDCTTEDVVAAVRRKAAQIRAQEGLRSPVAVLMASCTDLVVLARNERLAAQVQQANSAACEDATSRLEDFWSFIHGLPSDNPWQQILEDIRRSIPIHAYETWLKPTQFAGVFGRSLSVCVPGQEFKHIVEKFAEPINLAIQRLGLDIAAIECLTIDELVQRRERADVN